MLFICDSVLVFISYICSKKPVTFKNGLYTRCYIICQFGNCN